MGRRRPECWVKLTETPARVQGERGGRGWACGALQPVRSSGEAESGKGCPGKHSALRPSTAWPALAVRQWASKLLNSSPGTALPHQENGTLPLSPLSSTGKIRIHTNTKYQWDEGQRKDLQ